MSRKLFGALFTLGFAHSHFVVLNHNLYREHLFVIGPVLVNQIVYRKFDSFGLRVSHEYVFVVGVLQQHSKVDVLVDLVEYKLNSHVQALVQIYRPDQRLERVFKYSRILVPILSQRLLVHPDVIL